MLNKSGSIEITRLKKYYRFPPLCLWVSSFLPSIPPFSFLSHPSFLCLLSYFCLFFFHLLLLFSFSMCLTQTLCLCVCLQSLRLLLHRASEGGVSSPLLRRARDNKQVEYLDLDLHTGRSTPTRQVTLPHYSFFLCHVMLHKSHNVNKILFCAVLHTLVCFYNFPVVSQ